MTANAATLVPNVGSGATSGTVSVEGATRSSGVSVSTGRSSVVSSAAYADNDVITFKLEGGTWVDRSDFALVASKANVLSYIGGSLLGGNDASDVSFRLASGTIAKGLEFYLAASQARLASATYPSINVKNIASGGTVTLNYSVVSGFDKSIDLISKPAVIFNGVREYYASVLQGFDASISLVNQRKNFGGTTTPVLTDTLVFSLEQPVTATFGTPALDSDDKVNITINGDMSGLDNITLASKSFTISGETATLTGLDLQRAIGSSTTDKTTSKLFATAKVKGDVELAARSYKTTLVVDFDEENNQTLVNNASAGAWTVDQLNAVVSNMTLNASGFVSWLKVVNESVVDGTLKAVATWTEAGVDGAEATTGQTASVVLGTVKSKAVTTIGEADILKAIGKDSAKGVLDVSLNITVDAPKNELHIVAEKKASDGRVTTPVYYKSRDLGQ